MADAQAEILGVPQTKETPDKVGSTPVNVPENLSKAYKVADVRVLLGLGERSPLLPDSEYRESKKKVIDELLAKRQSEILEQKHGFIDVNIRYMSGDRWELTHQIPKGKVERAIQHRLTIFNLGRKGVKNPDKFVDLAESELGYGQADRIFDGHDEAVSILKSITPEQLQQGMLRLRTLGGQCSFYDLSHPEFVPLVKSVLDLTLPEFQKICNDLNPYFFMSRCYIFPSGSSEIDMQGVKTRTVIKDIIKNKGLLAEEKQKLDKLKRLALLNDNLHAPISMNNGPIIFDSYYSNLSSCLGSDFSDGVYDQIQTIEEECVYLNLQDKKEEKPYVTESQTDQIMWLNKNGRLGEAVSLVEKGIDVRKTPNPDFYKDFLENSEKAEWIYLFAELLGEKKVDLSLMESYEKLYKNRDEILNIATVIHSIPTEINIDLASIIGFWKASDYRFDDIETIIKLYNFLDGKSNTLNNPDDRKYIGILASLCDRVHSAHLTKELPVGVGKSFLEVLGYIAQNKQDLDSSIKTDVYNNQRVEMERKLIEELLTRKIPTTREQLDWYARNFWNITETTLSPKTVMEHVFDTRVLTETFYGLPVEWLEMTDYDPEEKDILKYIHDNSNQLANFTDTIFADRTRLKKFFRNGLPTPEFINQVLTDKKENGKYEFGLNGHLFNIVTDDVIDTFPSDEQPFWRFFRRYPSNLTLEERAGIINGRPSVALVEKAINSNDAPFVNKLSELLDAETVSSFPPDQQPFWEFMRDRPSDLAQFSLEKRGLIVNGKPTQEYFVEAISTSGSKNIAALLTDEVINSMPEDQKSLWRFIRSCPQDLCRFSFENRHLIADGKPTPEYFAEAINNGKKFKELLTDNIIRTFPQDTQPFWTFISTHAAWGAPICYKYRDLFDPKSGLPTKTFFEQEDVTANPDFKQYLTREIVGAFSPEDQPLWRSLAGMSRDSYIIAVKNRSLFDPTTGIPTVEFFEKTIGPDGNLSGNTDGVRILLRPEAVETFPESKRHFWLTISTLPSEFWDYILSARPCPVQTDADCDFFDQLLHNNSGALSQDTNATLGERMFNLELQKRISHDNIIGAINPAQFERLEEALEHSPDSFQKIDKSNWQTLLHAYVYLQNPEGNTGIAKKFHAKINDLFKEQEGKNLCLEELHALWDIYLGGNKYEAFPLTLNLTSEYIAHLEGAGPLSQIEAFSLFTKSVRDSFLRPTTQPVTKTEIMQGLKEMEGRFRTEKWSDEDRSQFYRTSKDILDAAPSLYTDFLSVFRKLKPKELKQFSSELFPLYRARLTLIEKEGRSGSKATHSVPELVHIRHDLETLSETVGTKTDLFSSEKTRLSENLKTLFKNRFGITTIPDTFTPEHIRSIGNTCLYLANLNNRYETRETTLGFYLALMINNQWEAYREGADIDPGKYLEEKRAYTMKELLERRKSLDPLTSSNLGIPEEEKSEFQHLLQQESQNVMTGNIETVDVKLHTIVTNLESLLDPDLYPEQLDKDRLGILVEFGNKKTGSTAAKMYQTLSGKDLQFTPEELTVKDRFVEILGKNNVEVTRENVKKYFQDDIKPLSTIVNMWQSVQDTRTETEIATLRQLIQPNAEIIELFNRLGEDFQPASGALAISQDLNFLDNLIVKRESELSAEEKTLMRNYVGAVRTQMVKMDKILGDIRNKFESVRKANITDEVLKKRIDEIGRIIYLENSQQAITSTMTTNMNDIIEDIRACLSCTTSGCNNDTDLTFGDSNKFFIYTKSETQEKGSIADQIVFAIPVVYKEGDEGMGLVMDRIYGAPTPDILQNHINTVLKTYRTLSRRFPGLILSVVVSQPAMASAGISEENLRERLLTDAKDLEITDNIEMTATIPESAVGEHYVEFASNDGGRISGNTALNGIVIRIKK